MTSRESLFPVFLKLAGRRVLVVGGGPVAASKLAALAAAGAVVHVVAPDVVPAIADHGVEVERREFVPADLDGVWFVVAAATPEVNRQVADAAESRHVFVNAVDDLASASAYLGGVVRKGGVTLAISTDGRAPALAGLLREGLESVLPDDLAKWHEAADAARRDWKADGVPMEARRPLLLQAINRLYETSPTRRRGEPGMSTRGHVALVGAGPGDPALLTRAALARLRRADLVLYDALVPPAIVALARRAQRFSVGKRCGRPSFRQETIHAPHDSRGTTRPAGRAAQGRRPVRLRARRRRGAGAARGGRALRGRARRHVGVCGAGAGRHPRHAPGPVCRRAGRLGPRRVELPAAAGDAAAALGHRGRADGAARGRRRSPRSWSAPDGGRRRRWRWSSARARPTSATWIGTLATHRVVPRGSAR